MSNTDEKISRLEGRVDELSSSQKEVRDALHDIKNDVTIKKGFIRAVYLIGAILGFLATFDIQHAKHAWHMLMEMLF